MFFGHKVEKAREKACSSTFAGARCTLDPGHDGPHKNGCAIWVNREHVSKTARALGTAHLAERASKRRSKP